MPLPMTHLSVAHGMVRDHGFPDDGLFYLGSIAPDAIHSRAGTSRHDKKRVHFLLPDAERQLRTFAAGIWRQQPSAAFVDGYCAHVLTDRLWFAEVIGSLRPQIPEGLSHAEHRRLYYRETDSTEIYLYDTVPWRAHVWERLARTPIPDADGLLTAQEISAWRDRVLRWPDLHRDKAEYEPRIYTRGIVQSFIDRAAGAVAQKIELWKTEAAVGA